MPGIGAGDLKHRVVFGKRPTQTADSIGNTEGEFVDHYPVWAALRPKFGGEQVQAERLTGIQPYTLTVRYSPEMLEVSTDWRARHCCDGNCGVELDAVFNIRSGPIDPYGTRQWLEMLVDAGGASG